MSYSYANTARFVGERLASAQSRRYLVLWIIDVGEAARSAPRSVPSWCHMVGTCPASVIELDVSGVRCLLNGVDGKVEATFMWAVPWRHDWRGTTTRAPCTRKALNRSAAYVEMKTYKVDNLTLM